MKIEYITPYILLSCAIFTTHPLMQSGGGGGASGELPDDGEEIEG